MDLEQKVGQMMMVGFEGPEPKRVASFVSDLKLGGVILFAWNIESADQVRALTSGLQNASKSDGLPGLLISVDQEGGSTTRLGPDICPEFPGNKMQGELFTNSGDDSHVVGQARETAECLLRLGINMNLAPVVDVVTDDGNVVIGSRAYGNDHELVGKLGAVYIRELQKNGVIATAKHFPGHGPTHLDSHFELPKTDISKEEAEKIHFSPFQVAIDNGVDAIMTAHMVYETFDSLPATLSYELINGQLRDKMGFDGIIITDDLNMLAIADNFTVEESVTKIVNAGVDILLVCGNEIIQRRVRDVLLAAVEKGKIPIEKINKAVDRILNVKKKYDLKNEKLTF